MGFATYLLITPADFIRSDCYFRYMVFSMDYCTKVTCEYRGREDVDTYI
jgi:hypothetical protein